MNSTTQLGVPGAHLENSANTGLTAPAWNDSPMAPAYARVHQTPGVWLSHQLRASTSSSSAQTATHTIQASSYPQDVVGWYFYIADRIGVVAMVALLFVVAFQSVRKASRNAVILLRIGGVVGVIAGASLIGGCASSGAIKKSPCACDFAPQVVSPADQRQDIERVGNV